MAAKKKKGKNKGSLVENINARKRAGKSRPKSRSTVSSESYGQMEKGWPKQAAKKQAAKKQAAKKKAAKKKAAKKKAPTKRAGAGSKAKKGTTGRTSAAAARKKTSRRRSHAKKSVRT